MKTSIRKMGNSQGVLIPKPFLAKIGMLVDEDIDIDVEDDKIVIRKLEKRPREGWAQASQKIAAAHDDALGWPEFANDGDKDLEW
ncbi:AbrB/MazE/SpoVT family DNA-binding domain-containing protein [Herbaspirillum seropedicae]|uniref:AbrB/MazE/SpoVT family DNA-binding domain-containing protein n=1 Tax=Herbaspirillum seropedicae TaxID=964 RepID=UPI003D98BBBB